MIQLSAAINAPLEAYKGWKGTPTPDSAFTWFTNLHLLLSRGPTISVSFWGSREISVAGCEGSISISQLAEETLRFVFPPQPSNFLSLKERYAALQVIDLLRDYYVLSDEILRNRNVITRTFLAIREWLYDKLGRWDPGFKQIKTPARTSLRETLGRPEVEDRLLTLAKRVWEKSFPTTQLPAPVPEFNPQPAGPEPDKTLNHGNDHFRWRMRCVDLEAAPAYPATRAQITAAIQPPVQNIAPPSAAVPAVTSSSNIPSSNESSVATREEPRVQTTTSATAAVLDVTASSTISSSNESAKEPSKTHESTAASTEVPSAQRLGKYLIQDVSPRDHTILFNGREWKCAGSVNIDDWKVNDKIILKQDHMQSKGWYLVGNKRLREVVYFSPCGISKPTVGGSAKSTEAKTQWTDTIHEVKENWIYLQSRRPPIQMPYSFYPPHWQKGDLVRLMRDGKKQYLKNQTQNREIQIK